MGKQRKGPPRPVPAVGEHSAGDEGVEVVRSGAGDAFFRPSVRPRAWDRLDVEGQHYVSHLQQLALQAEDLERAIAGHVRALRGIGASWDLIAWSLGMTATGARKRYGVPLGGD